MRRVHRVRPWMVLAAALTLGCAIVVNATRPHREVTTDSAAAYALYTKGHAQWLSYRFDAADSSWGAAIALDPGFAMAWGRRAFLAYQRGQVVVAREYAGRAESMAARLPALERSRIGWYRAWIEGDTQAERACIEDVLRRRPGDVEALFAIYQIQMEAGETEAGIRSLQEVLKSDPACVTAYNNMGYALADVGRFDEALESLRKYAFVNSDEPNPHDSLGELYERLGRYAEAEAEYARALAADSTFYWAPVHRARLLCATGRYRDALSATQQEVHGLSRVSRQMLYSRTICTYLDAGRYDEALRMSDSAGDSLMQPVMRLYERAAILKEAGDVAGVDAMRDSLLVRLDRGGETSAMSADFLRMSANALSHEAHGEWGVAADSVQAWLGRAVPGWESKVSALLRIADDLSRGGRFEESLAATGKILGDNPGHAKALCLQARALDRLGRSPDALESWRRAAAALDGADPGDPDREEAARRLALAGVP